jgi:eukaryotic-like serine/threonine-protein kinase
VTPLESIESFGRYRLLAIIGRGGMATLYLALQEGIERFRKVVALKRVLPRLSSSRPALEMFLAEARLAAKLDHPNIVATYELGQVNGDYFISMEYLPGEDVRSILHHAKKQEHQIPIEIAITLIKQVANALHHAHELRGTDGRPMGLVHRDVSPSNVLVTYHGAVKLVDFGIARAERGAESAAPFQGKFAHSAPEQLQGTKIDRRSDLFCVGILLWELLTGTRLFKGATAEEVAEAVMSSEIPPPSALRPAVPPELDALVNRALARRAEDRFQTAAEIYEALDALPIQPPRAAEKTIASWLQGLFGSERSELKVGIAQGRNLERLLPEAANLLQNEPEPTKTPPVPPTPFELPSARTERQATALKPWPAWSTGLAGAIAVRPPALRLAPRTYWTPPPLEPAARISIAPPRVSLAPDPVEEPSSAVEDWLDRFGMNGWVILGIGVILVLGAALVLTLLTSR